MAVGSAGYYALSGLSLTFIFITGLHPVLTYIALSGLISIKFNSPARAKYWIALME